jgi:hypothetical protein
MTFWSDEFGGGEDDLNAEIWSRSETQTPDDARAAGAGAQQVTLSNTETAMPEI